MFINVLLPEPDGPMMATKLPRRTLWVIPLRARTSTSPPQGLVDKKEKSDGQKAYYGYL
jgi:hypothetical protein